MLRPSSGARTRVSRRTKWNGRGASSLPALDPNLGASYSYWRVGQYTAFGGEHCSGDYRALWRAARPKARAAREGDSGPAPPEEGDVGQLQHRPVGLDFLGWRPFERENLRFLRL